MIQVIDKVARILELLSENKGRKVALSEIADKLDINRATCANIMKSLRDLNFVEQIDYRGGYVLGDKIFRLAGAENQAERLVAKLKPLLDGLCREVNENLMLAVINKDRRQLLYTVKGNHSIEATIIDDMPVWPATTAKVIIAQYDSKKLDDFIKIAGMPGDAWPEAKDVQGLLDCLAEIRAKRYMTVTNHHFACIASPVFKNGEVVASIGFYLPDIRLSDGRQEKLERRIVETAIEAEKLLQV